MWYLLRRLAITRANQVWALDTTYIQMARGFVYLTAVVDVNSRKVLAYQVAITLEAVHTKEVIEQAFARYGTPEEKYLATLPVLGVLESPPQFVSRRPPCLPASQSHQQSCLLLDQSLFHLSTPPILRRVRPRRRQFAPRVTVQTV
jgi:transposase InsO family protein